MKQQTRIAMVLFLVVTVFLASTTYTFAEATTLHPKKNPLIRRRSKTLTNFKQYWVQLVQSPVCKTGGDDKVCKNLAAAAVSDTCTEFGLFYQQEATGWGIATFALVLASAGFTGVGASSTLANAKIYSTLGGTTGLGAVTSQAKTNQSTDTTELNAVNAEIAKFQAFINDKNSTVDQILAAGPSYVGLCATAAPSPSTTPSSDLTVTTTTLTDGKVGTAYGPEKLGATGGTATYTWSADSLPNGLKLDPKTGEISGNPGPGSDGSTSIKFTVKDSSTPTKSATKDLTLKINK